MTLVAADAARSTPRRTRHPRDARIVLTAFVVAATLAVLWGHWVAHHASRSIVLGAIPFFGRWEFALSDRLVLVGAVATVLVAVLPRLATSWSWPRLVGAVAVGTVVLGAALAFADLPAERWQSIHTDYGQHSVLVDAFGGPGAFLRHYVAAQRSFPTHLSAHPPGMTLLLWGAGRVGLGGPGFESALSLLGAAVASAAALVALRNVAGDAMARAAAPFAVVVPAAVWHTNADTFFAGVAVTAIALVVVATSHFGRRSCGLALGGGALFGCALLLTYGVALLALPMVAVAAWRRRWAPLAYAAGAAFAVLLVPLACGFWWVGGLAATRHAYDRNLADVRPYWYFLFANLVVLASAAGPAVLVGLARLRDRRAWVLVGAALASVVVADLSGLSSAEVERIWQPFMPLVFLAGGAAVVAGGWSTRRWLAVQAAGAIALQAVLRSPW